MSTELDPVWKSLSDPTRRQILDLLRDQPRTTGDLAARFDMSRFGVMKHLRILEGAGLVVVRRRGRERWNHLNAVPIRQIYERWVDRYAGTWAHSLLALKHSVEHAEPQPTASGATTMSTFQIAQEIAIAAPRAKVWKALTSDIDSWWAFRVGEPGGALRLEARLGGQFGEHWGDGEGALWGVVTFLKVGTKLRLEGGLGMSGAGTNKYVYELEDRDGGTLLKLTHHAYGITDADAEGNYTKGWQHLLGVCLPAWVIDGKRYSELEPPAE